jgi:preprotein translocase subunit SecE
MSREQVAASIMWFADLFSLAIYKRTQGRITRQVTFGVLAITFLIAAWRLYVTFVSTQWLWLVCAAAGLLWAAGWWVSFRLVNMHRFADFLIAVEAEMNKVSWPSRAELVRSSVVVIMVLFLLALVLFGLDIVWSFVFEWLGILYKAPSGAGASL